MRKIILSGFVSGLAMLIFVFIFNYAIEFLFPSVWKEYETSGMFRAWSDPLMFLIFICPFIAGFVMAIIWNRIKSVFKGSPVKNGFIFGFFNCLLILSGMIMSYSSFNISFLMVLSWTISNFIQIFIACIIISIIIN